MPRLAPAPGGGFDREMSALEASERRALRHQLLWSARVGAWTVVVLFALPAVLGLILNPAQAMPMAVAFLGFGAFGGAVLHRFFARRADAFFDAELAAVGAVVTGIQARWGTEGGPSHHVELRLDDDPHAAADIPCYGPPPVAIGDRLELWIDRAGRRCLPRALPHRIGLGSLRDRVEGA
jgi:hypothetical protein